mmetsp:Transcript_36039/g.46290  ORF Transcript_36039/g.46290 Transcript_36039/m.46290 type:complete len:93 (+) Transcript_36039:184-462(+)
MTMFWFVLVSMMLLCSVEGFQLLSGEFGCKAKPKNILSTDNRATSRLHVSRHISIESLNSYSVHSWDWPWSQPQPRPYPVPVPVPIPIPVEQ